MNRNIKVLFVFTKTICVIALFLLLVYYMNILYECYYKEQSEEDEIRIFVEKWQEQKEQKEKLGESIVSTENTYKISYRNENNKQAKSDVQVEEASTQWLDENAKDHDDKNDKNIKVAYDCILIIPSIEINKYVYTGTKREQYLEQYHLITAAQDMKYQNGGNYIICGHYSKLYGHSLNRLKELNVGDDVTIWYREDLDTYKVTSISYINMKNTTQYCNQTNERELTIISCAKYEGKDKYLVVKCKYTN